MKQETQLSFKSGKRFKILCFGDLHERILLDTVDKELRFKDMNLFMQVTVKALQPDFVVLLGDTLCEWNEAGGYELYRDALARIIKPVTDAGIPYGYVMGNHEHDIRREELVIKAYDELGICYVFNEEPDITGKLNCCVPIRSSDGTHNAFNMWFIDSNNTCEDHDVSNYDWVHADQIQWYERRAEQLKEENGGITVPAVLFQHIPVTEEYRLLRPAKLTERPVAVKGHSKKKDTYYVAAEGTQGYVGEGPCAPDYNDGQFESWKKVGDVKGAFFGHDHLNDFTGEVDGILLGQNKTSGFNAYTDGCRSCVRMIELDEHTGTLKTRIYHYKDFGLKSSSLGPIFKRISDRQSTNMHACARILGVTAAVAAVPVAVTGLAKLMKK